MGFLSRLLGYATADEMAGAQLEGDRVWRVPGTRDGAAVLAVRLGVGPVTDETRRRSTLA